MSIKYISYKAIDKEKWDNCVTNANNGFIYSQSFFLDALCSWDALVMGNYEYIMPLPFKKKAGFKYIYTPFFIGQLGIIGKTPVPSNICNDFIKAIPTSFSFIDLQLNEYNEIDNTKKTERTNYILPIDQKYNLIAANFNKDAKKNIRQAVNAGLTFTKDVSLETVFDFYKKAYGHLNKRITEKDYAIFFSTCLYTLKLEKGFIAGVKNIHNEIVAAAFFAKDNKRVYYLLGAPSSEGKKTNATHFLIDKVIEQFAGNNDLVFDFEGSDIPSVANFYKKFSPQKKTYNHIIINRLPFWAKWLKK